MRRAVLACALALGAAACLELSGPPDGVASITALEPAALAVEVGDTLRDSMAVVAPLRVVAFDGNGDTTDADVLFSTLDTLVAVSTTGIVTGRTVSPTPGRVVARAGDLQTEPANIRVVPRIASVTRQVQSADTTYPAKGVQATILTPFGVTITGAGGVAVPSWLVRFRIVKSTFVAESPDITPVRIVADDNLTSSTVDTTNESGVASRKLSIEPLAIRAGRESDTVIVRVYVVRGATVDAADHTFVLRPKT